MPKVDVYTAKGSKSSKIDLPKEIFAAKVNPELMAQAVRVYLANQRKAKAKVKNRGEVTGSRRKIWRQKGTGRARHGDRYAPIFVGGGVTHGPTGQENYKLKMSKKMRQKSLFSALTSKLQNKEILVLSGLEKIEPKTKEMNRVLTELKLDQGKTSLVLPGALANVVRAGRNIARLGLMQANQLNTYGVLNGGKLVLMKESIGVIKETFLVRAAKKSGVKKAKKTKLPKS